MSLIPSQSNPQTRTEQFSPSLPSRIQPGLWPVSTYFQEPGLKALPWKFSLFNKCPGAGCNCYKNDFKGHLHRVAEEVEAKQGLCQSCARKGLLSSRGGN